MTIKQIEQLYEETINKCIPEYEYEAFEENYSKAIRLGKLLGYDKYQVQSDMGYID